MPAVVIPCVGDVLAHRLERLRRGGLGGRALGAGLADGMAVPVFVAVPAVVAYNQFAARIKVFASATDDFCRELLNSLEEIPVRGSAAPRDEPQEVARGFHD